MKKFLLILSFMLIVPAVSFAANYCVSPTGSGTGSGADWNNTLSWSALTPSRGNTYYLRNGTYASKTLNTANSGSTLITIKKATIADHVTDTGWSSSYANQAIINATFQIDSSYWLIDGQYKNESNWFDGTGYGFKIAKNSQDQQIAITWQGSSGPAVSNITVQYAYVEGLDTALPSYTIARYAVAMLNEAVNPAYSVMRFRHLYVDHSSNHILFRNSYDTVVEYSAFYANASNGYNHGESLNYYYVNDNAVIRWNKFNACVGTANIATAPASGETKNGLEVYGNVFWNMDVGDGSIGFSTGGRTYTNAKIFNNTIVRKVAHDNCGINLAGSQPIGNVLVYNNLFVNTSPGFFNGSNQTNAYNAYGTDPGAQGESNEQDGLTTAIFKNYAADDFTLASNTRAGINVGGYPYNVDLRGVTRTTWSRGAYEFVDPNELSPPSNLRILSQ